jgi:hypothetical protein
MTEIISIHAGDLAGRYPTEPFALSHGLSGHPLFTLPALADLARRLPRDRVEYNSGKVSPGVRPEDVPMIDLPPDEVVRRIEQENAWMVLKRVETQADYRMLLRTALEQIAQARGFNSCEAAGFRDIQGFIFVSSAHATTPFHFDPEENFFVQIHGRKAFHIFDNRDGSVLPDRELEMSPDRHRNAHYDATLEAKAKVFEMGPGDGMFVPHLWPHWVRTFDSHSISMAITWKSPQAERLNTLLRANGLLRRFGLAQARPGRHRLLDTIKVVAYRSGRMAVEPLRRSETMRRRLRGLLFGKSANYYYREERKA